MYLNFLCADQARVVVQVSGEPLWQAATRGDLDEQMLDFVSDVMTLVYDSLPKKVDFFRECTGILGITYSGVLNQPDSLPNEEYDEEGVSVLCEWEMSKTTALYSVPSVLEDALGSFDELVAVEEASQNPKPVWPSVAAFYLTCVGMFSGLKVDVRSLGEDIAFTAVRDRANVLSGEEQTDGAYYEALEANHIAMNSMVTIFQALFL